MLTRTLLLACVLAVGLPACGGSVFAARDIRFTLGVTEVVVLENGAIVIDKERVGEVKPDGKMVGREGKLVMWVRESDIVVRGGGSIPIRTDEDGALYLPEGPQQRAGIKPMTRRLRTDGTLAISQRSGGIEVRGAKLPRNRRIVLGVLLALENKLWQ